MAEIHLARESGKQIPTGRQDGKDAGQNDDPDNVRILMDQRESEQGDEKKTDDDPAREDQHLISDDFEKFLRVKQNKTHGYLSSSKATPKRPSGRISRTRIMIVRATDPLRKAPLGTRKTTRAYVNPRMKAATKLPLMLPRPPRTTTAIMMIRGSIHM